MNNNENQLVICHLEDLLCVWVAVFISVFWLAEIGDRLDYY